MQTLSEVERITAEVYEDYVTSIEPTMEREARSKARNFVEWDGEGVWLLDVAGNRYLDACAAGGVFGLGYKHPRVVAAVMEQLQRMPQPSRAGINPLQGKLARRLREILPGDLSFSHIATTGTEAIEAAVKVARLHTGGRPEFVSTQGAFHGMAFAATSIGGIPYLHDGIKPILEGCRHVPYGNLDALKAVVSDKTAAVILEPILSAAGCIPPPPGYLKGVRELCDKHGALLIADEIQTAFRTGTVLGFSHEDVVPDIVCLGKILGGGVMPIGAAVWTTRIQESVSKKPLFNNTTFGGNQLSAAAALATLDVIEQDGLVERSVTQGAKLMAELKRLAAKYPKLVKKVEGRGLMTAFELSDMRWVASFIPRVMQKHRMVVLAAVFALQRIRINPPLILSDDELAKIIEILDTTFAELDPMTPEQMLNTWQRWCAGEPPEF